MAEIRVELRDFTDNILGNLDITSSDDFPLSLTFQNFDVRDFSSRSGSFSKTFNVPATRNNNKLFNHIYKDGNIDRKKVRKDIPSTIYADNLPVVSGALRLYKVTKDTDVLEYECNFLGDNMDWASKIKNLDLNELKFSKNTYASYPPISEGNYTFDNVIPLTGNAADYTNFNSNRDRLHYPLMSFGEGVSSRPQVTEADFAPAFYLKNIWDKIFQAQGYTVESEFCNSPYFKSLIVPFDFESKGKQQNFKYGRIKRDSIDETISEFEANNRVLASLFKSGTSPTLEVDSIGNMETIRKTGKIGGTSVYAGQLAKFVFSGTNIIDDAETNTPAVSDGNVRQGTSGKYTTLVKSEGGTHTIRWDITARFYDATGDDGGRFAATGQLWRVQDDDNEAIYAAEAEEDDELNGYQKLWEQTYERSVGGTYDIDLTWNDEFFDATSGASKYIFCIEVQRFSDDSGSTTTFGFKSGTFEIGGSNTVSIGDSLNDIEYFIPDGKQSDFISGVAQMFNLQFSTDAASKVIKIEPYDYFYKGISDAVNWTDKIDYSKNIKDEFINDIKSELIFKYKDASNDGMLERYNKKSTTDWGAYREIDEDGIFSDGSYVVENKYFSPTFNYSEPDYIDREAGSEHNVKRSPVIPMYFQEFSNLDFPRFVDRGERNFGIGARVLITLPLDETTERGTYILGGNENVFTYLSTGLTDSLTSGYSYNSNGEMQPSNVFNDEFCRACFIHHNNCTIPKTSLIPSGGNWSSLTASELNDIYDSRAKLSMGNYGNGNVFLDPNLSFNDVYLTDSSSHSKIDFRGLYHSFYSKMLNQLKQKPRIRNVYINLSKKDISTLDFTKLIYLDGLYYRLNKIIDFKPHLNESTKVELVEYFDLGKEEFLKGDKFNWDEVNDKF